MNIPIYKTSIKIIPIIINAANILALGLSCIHTVYHARDGLPKQLLLKNKQYFYKNTPFYFTKNSYLQRTYTMIHF
jgi:hypothetical protein